MSTSAPTIHTYEARFGNVAVGYGYPKPDQAFLARIKAAVADLSTKPGAASGGG